MIIVSFSDLINDSPVKAEIYIFALWCFNYMLVETIYVCMGFSLYINSRIEVEGWDLEIKFRSFSQKYGKQIKKSVLLFVFYLACVFLPVNTYADDLQPSPAGENVPFEELQNILESPDFGGEEDSWGIRLKKPPEKREPSNTDFSPFFEKIRLIFASLLRIFLIAIIIALAVVLFIFARKLIYNRIPVKKKPEVTALRGIQSKNPDELLEKSLDYYKQGELRLAWGYCTAAVILSWQLYRSVVFPPNVTENECADIVNLTQPNSGETKIFGYLIKYWVNFAYAGRIPPLESFNEAVNYCRSLGNS